MKFLHIKFILVLALKFASAESEVTRVAIIGAGAGGCSAAYHLSELFGGTVAIDIFEATSYIGGRMATVELNGKSYEIGGSIIHTRNELASNLAQKFSLGKLSETFRKQNHTTESTMSISKNSQIVFKTSQSSFITIIKLFLRYGLDPLNMKKLTAHYLDAFSKIYELQNEGLPFDSVEDMLNNMDPELLNLTKSHYDTFLRDLGYGENFATELVQGISYVNYGQPISSLHSLVGAISSAGFEGGVWSVEDGNWKLAEALLENTKNSHLELNTTIQSIIATGTTFKLSTDPSGLTPLPTSYDKVIVATPISKDHRLEFIGFPDSMKTTMDSYQSVTYHQTVATVVAGRLTPKFENLVDLVISDAADSSNNLISVSRIYPTSGIRLVEEIPVYKIFSGQLLTNHTLEAIFEDVVEYKLKDWLAYPNYEIIPSPLPSFILHPNLYYLNGIELAASAIEMSLISGRNAANHIAKIAEL